MTEEEWVGVADFIDNAWPATPTTSFSESREATYRAVLVHYSVEDVQAALLALTLKGEALLPSLGKIIAQLERESRPTWLDVWDMVGRAMRRFGVDGEAEGIPALERRHRLYAVFVQKVGWRRLFHMDTENEKLIRSLEWQYKALVEQDEEETIEVKAITAGQRLALGPHKPDLQRALGAGPTEGGAA